MTPYINEAVILRRAIEPERPTLSAAAARALLAIDFSPTDKSRMRDLAARARACALTAAEQAEIDTYGRVGSLLSILRSKARRSLKQRTKPGRSAG